MHAHRNRRHQIVLELDTYFMCELNLERGLILRDVKGGRQFCVEGMESIPKSTIDEVKETFVI